MDQHILWKLNYHSMESGLQTWRSCDRKWDTNQPTDCCVRSECFWVINTRLLRVRHFIRLHHNGHSFITDCSFILRWAFFPMDCWTDAPCHSDHICCGKFHVLSQPLSPWEFGCTGPVGLTSVVSCWPNFDSNPCGKPPWWEGQAGQVKWKINENNLKQPNTTPSYKGITYHLAHSLAHLSRNSGNSFLRMWRRI